MAAKVVVDPNCRVAAYHIYRGPAEVRQCIARSRLTPEAEIFNHVNILDVNCWGKDVAPPLDTVAAVRYTTNESRAVATPVRAM